LSTSEILPIINDKLRFTDTEGSKIARVGLSKCYGLKQFGLFAKTSTSVGTILFQLNGKFTVKHQVKPQVDMIVADVLHYTTQVDSGEVQTIMCDMSSFFSCCGKYIKGDVGKVEDHKPNVVLQYVKNMSIFQIFQIRDINPGN
jgi:hypothetical protein